MAATHFIRSLRPAIRNSSNGFPTLQSQSRAFGASALRAAERFPGTAEEHREIQKNRPLNQTVPNTTSTQTKDFPKVGAASSPPDFLSTVDPNYKPADPYTGKLEHLTGGRETAGAQKPELEVGEMEGITFKVEPLKRQNEDTSTMRARLLYQSRKRGILETDLLLSTFADVYLGNMSKEQLQQYDKFLDENDWDIYYWATQEPKEAEETASSSAGDAGSAVKVDTPTEVWKQGAGKTGEWAQTVGAFKPAYRPLPSRWAESEVLALVRQHVLDKSAVGFQAAKEKKRGGSGLGRMPDVKVFDS